MNPLNPTERFSNRVQDYVRYRPGYPTALITYLVECCGLKPTHIVADIGSGTGLLTQPFLEHGNQVYGIEPNASMRFAAEELLQPYNNFESREGRAEDTPLAPTSVDWIVAGQAFHWFEPTATRQEFARILRPGGQIAIIWNSRLTSDPFQQAYEQFLRTHAPDYGAIRQQYPTASELEHFFAPATMEVATFENHQVFDFNGLKGRLLSCAYAPKEDAENYEPMIEKLRSLFQNYSHNNQLIFRYTTYLYYGQRPFSQI